MKKLKWMLLPLVLFTSMSFAWDGAVTGKIKSIEVSSGPENYAFRVIFHGGPALCGNEHKWAYVNKSNANYETFVAALLSAKAMQSNVTLYTNRKDGSPTGFCAIGHIRVDA